MLKPDERTVLYEAIELFMKVKLEMRYCMPVSLLDNSDPSEQFNLT